ncbi:MAG: glycosyl hydrolase [Acidobacteriota bacterium]|jgi:hypothetical protein
MRKTILLFIVFIFCLRPDYGSGQNSYKSLDNPDASPEAVALYKYLQDMAGKKILSGQMWAPWGIDEEKYIQETTGKLPAIKGVDFIHERDNQDEVQRAMDYWEKGGISTIMWHWGAPAVGEGYQNSKKEIDTERRFIEGTPEYISFWNELKIKADHLEKLRDAGVPIIWRPFHELNGDWFWWGKKGPEAFIKLWRTMYDYFTRERRLNNLIWTLCYMDTPDGAWNPGEKFWDIAGADTYRGGKTPHLEMFAMVKRIVGDDKTPITFHECGIPPDPDETLKAGAKWSWWMQWHTNLLTNIDKEYLNKVYHHEEVITLDEVPDIMAEYGK